MHFELAKSFAPAAYANLPRIHFHVSIRRYFLQIATTIVGAPLVKGTVLAEDLSILTRRASAPDKVVTYGVGTDQVIDVRFGDNRAHGRPLVVLLHGGFWRPQYDRAETASMAATLAAAGWTVATVEYRRIPGDPDATLGDIACAIEKLPAEVTHHSGRMVVAGNSAGGHLALWAAVKCATPRLQGILALAPLADLQLAHEHRLGNDAVMAFLGVDPGNRLDADPRQLGAPAVPVTIVHGEEDGVVPLVISESYLATFPKSRLIRLRDSGHFALIDPLSGAWPTVVTELERLSGL